MMFAEDAAAESISIGDEDAIAAELAAMEAIPEVTPAQPINSLDEAAIAAELAAFASEESQTAAPAQDTTTAETEIISFEELAEAEHEELPATVAETSAVEPFGSAAPSAAVEASDAAPPI